MNNIGKGLVAGFLATIVLSAIMLLKAQMGMFPELNAINMQANLLNNFAGLPATPMTGWISHFVIGTIFWGGIFGAFNRILPGRTELAKSTTLAIFAWLLMMVIVMPLAGAGLFGLALGIAAPIVTLALHIVYGLVMGYSYAKLMNIPATQKLPVPEAA